MQLSYGGTPISGANQCMVTSDLRTHLNEGGQPVEQERTYSVTGYLATAVTTGIAAQQADLAGQENALKALLALPYRDLILQNDDGSNSSELLLNSGSLTGVIIEDLAFPRAEGPEYATIRSFSFRARATYPYPGTGNLLWSWHESLRMWGGRPIYAMRRAINGPPQRQLIWPITEYAAAQSGEIVGYLAYPTVPAPLFPQALKEAPVIDPGSPKRRGAPNTWTHWPIRYSYSFESVGPLAGVPRKWVS
jgi:hypothetical protein